MVDDYLENVTNGTVAQNRCRHLAAGWQPRSRHPFDRRRQGEGRRGDPDPGHRPGQPRRRARHGESAPGSESADRRTASTPAADRRAGEGAVPRFRQHAGQPDAFHSRRRPSSWAVFRPTHPATSSRPRACRSAGTYLSRHPVTNAEYEKFDPAHKARRGALGGRPAPGHLRELPRRHEVLPVAQRQRKANVSACRRRPNGSGRPRGRTPARTPGASRPAWARWPISPTRTRPFPGATRRSTTGTRRPHPWAIISDGVSPFGMDDMAGNVWEWCLDIFDAYKGGEKTNPRGPVSTARSACTGAEAGSRASQTSKRPRGRIICRRTRATTWASAWCASATDQVGMPLQGAFGAHPRAAHLSNGQASFAPPSVILSGARSAQSKDLAGAVSGRRSQTAWQAGYRAGKVLRLRTPCSAQDDGGENGGHGGCTSRMERSRTSAGVRKRFEREGCPPDQDALGRPRLGL